MIQFAWRRFTLKTTGNQSRHVLTLDSSVSRISVSAVYRLVGSRCNVTYSVEDVYIVAQLSPSSVSTWLIHGRFEIDPSH